MVQAHRVTFILIALQFSATSYAQSLADTPVAGGFSLETPTIGSVSAEAAELMLRRAGVPYGIEQAPPARDVPPAEIGKPIAGTVRFSGTTVRAALDKLVELDPRYD